MKNKKLFLKTIVLLILSTFIITFMKLVPIKAGNFDDYIESSDTVIKDSIINAEFDNSINSEIRNTGEVLNVKYNISLNELKTDSDATNNSGFYRRDEAVFLIDTSAKMKENISRVNLVKEILRGIKNEKNLDIGVMGFAKNDYVYNFLVGNPGSNWNEATNENNLKMYDLSKQDDVNKVDTIISNISSVINGEYTNTYEVSLDKSLSKSIDLLGEDNNKNNKSIVIVTAGNYKISEDVANKIKSKGYKIILFDISSNNDTNNIIKAITTTPIKEYTINNTDTQGNLEIKLSKAIHLKVLPLSNGKYDTGNLVSLCLNGLVNSIKISDIYNTNDFSLINPRLILDIGKDFQLDENVEVKIKYGQSENNIRVSNNNNVLEINLSDFISYTKNNNSFIPNTNNIEVSFNITTNTTGDNISFSKHNNGKSKSYLLYTLNIKDNNINQKKTLEVPNITVEPLSIKVLEIEPGDRFKLTAGGQSIDPNENAENKKVVEREEDLISSDGTLVNVTHISMPEFISMIDELNGKYDVIVIGRENTGVKINEYGNWKVSPGLKSYFDYNYKYRDYTNPFEQTTDIRAFEDEDYKNKEVEYYSENDITDKRINEIMEMINSGQLVYMDANIYTKDTYYEKTDHKYWFETTATHEPITETKLWKLYDQLIRRNDIDNFKVFSQQGDIITKNIDGVLEIPNRDDITIDKIVEDYKQRDYKFKRPIISNVIEPTDNDITNRTIKVKFKIKNRISDTFKINLYLDSNGDGLFKEDELHKSQSITVKQGENEYEIEGRVNENFFGYLGWKVEIVKESGVKTNLIGNCIIERDSSVPKKEINVVQIYPWPETNQYDPRPTDLFNNAEFKKLTDSLEDYDITITTMSSGDFNKYVRNGNKLNGNYNAVIIGFGNNDSNYTGEFTSKAIEEIKEFIKTGQSIMFTSDTMGMQIKNVYGNNDLYYLTSQFRDYLGQSRFKDPYNLEETDINGDKITHMDLDERDNGKYSAGLSLIRANIGSWIGASSIDGKYYARNINSTQIDSYPFNISNRNIEIGSHAKTQYYQLNLEDEDVVPLYNILNTDRANSGDSRNFYYAYSKGNITYCSSLGDLSNGRKFPTDELKLFINTIIKTDSNSNHAPNIKSKYLGNYIENNGVIKLSNIPEVFNFDTMANDIDGDKVKLQVNIDGEETNSMISNGYEPEGTNFTVNIPISKLKEVSSRENKRLNIKIIAEDEKGAVSEANYIVDLTDIVYINHGIYKGIIENKLEIDESGQYNNPKLFASGSIVTCAANINNISGSNNIVLDIDENFESIISEPKIYGYVNEQLIEINNINTQKDNNKYLWKDADFGQYTNIVVTYSVKLKEDIQSYITYTNNINVNGQTKPLYIGVSGKLPDLF